MLKIIPRDASDAVPAAPLAASGRRTAVRLVAAAVVLAALSAAAMPLDLAVAQFVSDHALPGELRRLVRLSEVFAWGGTVALIVLTAAVLDPRGWRVLLPLAAPAFGAGLLADGIKLFVARLRPSAAGGIETVQATFVGWLPVFQPYSGHPAGHAIESFPSGHAATAVGLAVGLAALYPHGRWLFAVFALLAMLQRIEAQAHFSSDVLAGAAVGCLVGAVWQVACNGSTGPARQAGPMAVVGRQAAK